MGNELNEPGEDFIGTCVGGMGRMKKFGLTDQS